MPGIVGIIGPGGPEANAELLRRMLLPMLHEAFYSYGTQVSESAQIAVGCVRAYASVAPSFIWNAAHEIGCFIAGEEFVDASTLVHLYEELGTPALEKLNGWFSGVLVDLRQQKTILFNDRYGLSRVYVHQAGDRLFFSAEAKSLLAVLPDLRRLDPRGVGEWFACGCVLQNRTLFAGIELLPPGSCWSVSANGLVKAQYFKPATLENQPPLSAAAYTERLIETFPRVLKRSFEGRQPVGMSLTGGLDGRMIMAWLPRGPGEVPCYTFNGPIRDCADVTIARQVAKQCGQKHHTIPIGAEFLARFPELAARTVYITDGAMDVTGAVELYANRLALEIAPVRMTGNYGSEIVRQHVAFKPRQLRAELLAPDFVEPTRQAARTYADEARGNRLAFIAFKQVPWHHYSRLAIEQSQLTMRSPFLDNELVALAFQAPAGAATDLEPSLKLIAAGNPELARMPTDRGVTYPPANRLVNRWRQAFHDTVAKAEYAYDYGMPDWAARVDRPLQPFHLERLFLGRQKFCHFRIWYRDQLAGYVKEILLDKPSRACPFVNWRAVEPLIAGHLRGHGNLTMEIHKLISLELINRTLLEYPVETPSGRIPLSHSQSAGPLGRGPVQQP